MATTKDGRDTAPSDMIGVSAGASLDPRSFYSTTNSTTFRHHAPASTPLLAYPINGVSPKDLKPALVGGIKVLIAETRRRTGYTKNVIPHVNYDKDVDESDAFRIVDPFKTRTVLDYVSPPRPGNLDTEQGVNAPVESGFTRLPKFKVTEDGTNHREKKSQMKTSYDQGLTFKASEVSKGTIIPSTTAYISDAGEIKELGSVWAAYACDPTLGKSVAHAKALAAVADTTPRPENPTKMTENGFCRSHRHRNMLRADHEILGAPGSPDPRDTDAVFLEALRHRDLAEWVQKRDPATLRGLSRIVHQLGDVAPIRASQSIRIGLKEPTGAVQNNDKYTHVDDPDPIGRLATETGLRYQPPKDRYEAKQAKCNTIALSGFSRGNEFRYRLDAPRTQDVLLSMHPTLTKYHWHKERGLHTSKPSRTHAAYTLATET
ncbi:hypothetical protein DFJ73DRAFT_828213 [Zopfochytrium polystomum]|nr:hypothetical protein DFJ73DRAFT_828213 [Zopfochytrium polystomum]